MNFIYTKVIGFFLGEALAHSDRIKVAIAGFLATAILQLSAACGFCQALLTPDLVDKLSMTIAGLVVTLIGGISARDTKTPAEAAGADAFLPAPPADALGLPGDPPVIP